METRATAVGKRNPLFWKMLAASLWALDTRAGGKHRFYLAGKGNNGKTALITVVKRLLGADCFEHNNKKSGTPVIPKLEIFSDFDLKVFDFDALEHVTETAPARRSCWLVEKERCRRPALPGKEGRALRDIRRSRQGESPRGQASRRPGGERPTRNWSKESFLRRGSTRFSVCS